MNGVICEAETTPISIVIPALPVTVLSGIAASAVTVVGSGTLTICDGENVTFTATNGVRYEFFNAFGSLQASSTSNTYSSTTLSTGDAALSTLTSATASSSRTTRYD